MRQPLGSKFQGLSRSGNPPAQLGQGHATNHSAATNRQRTSPGKPGLTGERLTDGQCGPIVVPFGETAVSNSDEERPAGLLPALPVGGYPLKDLNDRSRKRIDIGRESQHDEIGPVNALKQGIESFFGIPNECR